MAEDKTSVVCTGCGEAFQVFLKDMADHNAKIVCPRCGKVYQAPRKP